MKYSSFPCYLVPLRPKYLPQQPILEHPQPAFLRQCQRPSFTPIRKKRHNFCHVVRDMVNVYGEEVLAPRPTPKLEYHPLSAVRDCLFNIFSQLPSIYECPSSNRKIRTRHPVATGTHLSGLV